MRPMTTLAAIGAALTLTLAGCGDDYDADLVDALEAQGATQDEAECFIDELGEDGAQAFLDSIDADSPPDDAEEILAALEECGVEPDGPAVGDSTDGAESAPAPTEGTEATDGEAAPQDSGIETVASCLEAAGLEVTVDDGPPARIDIIGSGSGAVFDYGDPSAAADASKQFIDSLGGGDGEFLSGSAGSMAYYYLNSADEGAQLQECVG